MLKLKKQSYMLFFCALVGLISVSSAQAQEATAPNANPVAAPISAGVTLSGDELLIEATDAEGKLGIYAMDVLKGDGRLTLLSPGATMARWSPRHKKIFYIKNNAGYIKELVGSEVLWDEDKILGRFFDLRQLQRGRIFWDLSGKMNFISYWEGFGLRLDRSVGLKEDIPVTPRRRGICGFIDTLIPVREGVKYSIADAAVSSDESRLAVQMYPAGPKGAPIEASRVWLYKAFYSLAKTDMAAWEKKVDAVRKAFLINEVIPQLEPEAALLGSPKEFESDSTPRFAPSGQFIAMNRYDARVKTIRPVLVNLAQPDKVIELKIESPGDELLVAEDRIVGFPSYMVQDWSSDFDRLWIMDGLGERVFVATETNGEWQVKNVLGLDMNLGVLRNFVTYKGHFAGNYVGQSRKIYYYAATGDKEPQTVELPEGMSVRALSW